MFKDNFTKLCNERNEAPSNVCKNIGLSASTYSYWTDESVPHKRTLLKIAEYFNVTVDDLLSEEKKPVHVDEPEQGSLSAEKKILLSAFDRASDDDRRVLWTLLDKYQTKTEDTFIDSNVNYGMDNGISTVYETPIKLHREKEEVINDIQYYKYYTGLYTKINGEKVSLCSFCKINNENNDLALFANLIFGDKDIVPLQIVKTVNYITIDQKTYSNVIYTLQIKSVDDNGTELICPFVPKDENNRVMFQNIINVLKSTGNLD